MENTFFFGGGGNVRLLGDIPPTDAQNKQHDKWHERALYYHYQSFFCLLIGNIAFEATDGLGISYVE